MRSLIRKVLSQLKKERKTLVSTVNIALFDSLSQDRWDQEFKEVPFAREHGGTSQMNQLDALRSFVLELVENKIITAPTPDVMAAPDKLDQDASEEEDDEAHPRCRCWTAPPCCCCARAAALRHQSAGRARAAGEGALLLKNSPNLI